MSGNVGRESARMRFFNRYGRSSDSTIYRRCSTSFLCGPDVALSFSGVEFRPSAISCLRRGRLTRIAERSLNGACTSRSHSVVAHENFTSFAQFSVSSTITLPTKLGENCTAVLFNKIANCTNAQVVMNVHGSWPNHALALGMKKCPWLREQFFEFVRRCQQDPGEMERVATAQWQDVVVDKDVNLFELIPLFRLNRGDGGYYINKASTVSRDADDWDNDNVENARIYRIQVKGCNRIGIQIVPQRDIAVPLALR